MLKSLEIYYTFFWKALLKKYMQKQSTRAVKRFTFKTFVIDIGFHFYAQLKRLMPIMQAHCFLRLGNNISAAAVSLFLLNI